MHAFSINNENTKDERFTDKRVRGCSLYFFQDSSVDHVISMANGLWFI